MFAELYHCVLPCHRVQGQLHLVEVVINPEAALRGFIIGVDFIVTEGPTLPEVNVVVTYLVRKLSPDVMIVEMFAHLSQYPFLARLPA